MYCEDHAQIDDRKGFSVTQLEALMSDIDAQPPWRDTSQKCCDYYDGMQLTDEEVEEYEERGQPILINNLIAPTVDAVLGMEVRTRHDLVLAADDEKGEDLKDALQEKFKDAWRLARGDRACADAYAGQIKAGIGWVEVTRNDDVFSGGGKYKIKNVRRQEMFWDWHAEEADLSDARWMLRKRWIDIDEAISWFPKQKDIIENNVSNWDGFLDTELQEETEQRLHSAHSDWESWSRKETEWLDRRRSRILMSVVYYKTWRIGEVVELENGRIIEFNPNNMVHVVGVKMKRFSKRVARWAAIRESWFVGPHRIVDRPCTAPTGYYPLVPFIAYRQDKSGAPYGIVSRMISAQDEINFRRMRLTWLLQAKRVIADQDATNMSREALLKEVHRADGYIELNPDRRNKKTIAESIQVQQDFDIAAQQFNVMKDAMDQIQSVAGVYNAMMGQDSSATSGVALNALVEQGATTLAEVNDNYNYSRTRVADLQMAYLIEDLAKQNNIAVTVHKEDMHRKKVIRLNVTNDDGSTDNSVKRWKGHITQAPAMATPTYRAQLAQELMQAVSKMPQEIQMATLDMVVELMDIPNKQEFLDRLRKVLNIPKSEEDMTGDEKAAAMAEQEKAQQMEQMQFKTLMQEVEKGAEQIKEIQARVEKLKGETKSGEVKDDKTEAETSKILQEMLEATRQTNALKNSVMGNINAQLASMNIEEDEDVGNR